MAEPNAYLEDYYATDDSRRRFLLQQPQEPAPGTETSPTDPVASAPVRREQRVAQAPPPQDAPAMPDFQRLYPVHQRANLQSMPQPEQYGLGARQQAAGGFEVFKNPLIWIGILGSLLTRRPALAAMTFAGAAMKGYDAGETQKFEENKIKFDEAVRQTEAQNRVELEKYKEIWESDQEKNWQTNLPKLWAEAAKNGDSTMQQLLQIGAPMEQIEKYMMQKGEKQTQLIQQLELLDFKNHTSPKWLASPQGQDYISTLPPDKQKEMREFVQQYAPPAGTTEEDIKNTISGIEKGLLPPSLVGLYRTRAKVEGGLAKDNFNLANAQLEWARAQAQVHSLNAPQMVRFVGLANSVINTIDRMKFTADQLRLSGVPLLNKLQLESVKEAEGNSPKGQLVAQYLADATALKEEMANLINGGYAPHEAAFTLANRLVNENFGVKQLHAALDESQRLVRYRVNAIPGLSQYGPGAKDRYMQGDTPEAPATTDDDWGEVTTTPH